MLVGHAHMSAYVSIRPSAYVSIRCAWPHLMLFIGYSLEAEEELVGHTLGTPAAGVPHVLPLAAHLHASACVSIRQHTSAFVSIRQHTSAYAGASHVLLLAVHLSRERFLPSIRRHTSAYVSIRPHTSAYVLRTSPESASSSAYVRIRRHTSAYVRIRQHTSAYVSIRPHTSAYVSIRAAHLSRERFLLSIRPHTSAYVRIRPHTSAYVRIRPHTSAYVRIRPHTSAYVLRTSPESASSSGESAHISKSAHAAAKRLPLFRAGIRQHTSAYVIRARADVKERTAASTSASVSIRHQSARSCMLTDADGC
jgi:hypothetical protein